MNDADLYSYNKRQEQRGNPDENIKILKKKLKIIKRRCGLNQKKLETLQNFVKECENDYNRLKQMKVQMSVKDKKIIFMKKDFFINDKIRDLSVAPELISDNWEEMIEDDMKSIPYSERRYELPANLASHIDVYKVQCEIPLLLNFYYVDETASIPSLDYGHVSIFTLKTKQTVSIPFVSGFTLGIFL